MASLISFVLVGLCFSVVVGQPFQYFVANPAQPAISEDIYMYAIDPVGTADQCQIILPGSDNPIKGCQVVKTGDIMTRGTLWGRYIRIRGRKRKPAGAYGSYNATFTNLPGCSVEKCYVRTAFVQRKSDSLDTGGVWTVTVYRDPQNVTKIVPTSIGLTNVKKNSLKFHWRKDGVKLSPVSGNRLCVTEFSDAGSYTIERRSRASRGWSVTITVTIASCPEGMALKDCGDCEPFPCPNGGVPTNDFRQCTCPNLFDPRTLCNLPYPSPPDNPFVIGFDRTSNAFLSCEDLPGGNPKCKGMLFCQGELFGCKCGSGWRGSGCDKPCKPGTWGPGCTLTCPENDWKCDRFFGPPSDGVCA